MDQESFNQGLLAFLDASPTPFHATARLRAILAAEGFTELNETDAWQLTPGRYLVTRNDSSLIAFVLGEDNPVDTGIRMSGAHTDSPCFKVKPQPEIRNNGYLQLGVEVYGGVLLGPWFDRDLSLAGRVTVTTDGAVQSFLLDWQRAVAVIPNLAIHLDREANSSHSINAQTDIPPILMHATEDETFSDLVRAQLQLEHGVVADKVLAWELCCYDTQGAALIGMNREFLASARLDNLLSCYTGIRSLLGADPALTSLVVCNDHEEVGSASTSGAQGTFLKDVLTRMIPDTEARLRALSRSLLVSTDNAHGVHPNFAAKHDGNHGPKLNQGPVIKINANQRYATNSETEALFANLCGNADVPVQKFVNRTDLACGSTIGPITATEIGVATLDVGVPTFAMHSCRELAGASDAFDLHRALVALFQSRDLAAAH